MGDKTKIDWADSTWNPITGCLHGCEYCYARKIAERFGGYQMPIFVDYPILREPYIINGRKNPYPFDFTPTFHRYKLDEPKRWAKPRTIFVCSMADLFGAWVPDEWIQAVFEACLAAPQHRYLFLTKNPKRYIDLIYKGIIPYWTEARNMWLGSTATTKQAQVFGDSMTYNTFMSVEPIMEPFFNLGERGCIVDWVIVGAETGRRKNKVIPKKEWIMEIADKCRATGTPLFMKESLRGIMGADFVQEYPWEGETK